MPSTETQLNTIKLNAEPLTEAYARLDDTLDYIIDTLTQYAKCKAVYDVPDSPHTITFAYGDVHLHDPDAPNAQRRKLQELPVADKIFVIDHFPGLLHAVAMSQQEITAKLTSAIDRFDALFPHEDPDAPE